MKLPTIGLVTPSLNQARFLEAALNSVLSQSYPSLRYFLVDGGSVDGSLAILERFRSQLDGLIIEPDNGQYDAINKGFEQALANSDVEVMGWLNSDDLLLPGALQTVGEIFAAFPEVEWITCLVRANSTHHGRINSLTTLPGMARDAFIENRYLPAADPFRSFGFIQQESSFWRRSLWERSGGYLSTLHGLAGDYELWRRFYNHGQCVGLTIPLALNRVHSAQQSADIDRYNSHAMPLIHNVTLRQKIRLSISNRIRKHSLDRFLCMHKWLLPHLAYRGRRIVLESPQGPSCRWRQEDYWFL